MPDEALKRQLEACRSTVGNDSFAPYVMTLFKMLPEEQRAEIESVGGVCTVTENCVNRFINNVLITVEFVTTKTYDHKLLFAEILKRVDD